MNHRHRKVLHALFAHPVSANIHAADVEAVLGELGAELDHSHHGKLTAQLDGHTLSIGHSSHTLNPDQVRQVRKFLEDCGVSPAAYPA
ncbi:MAG: hypothetical protein U1E52_06450 [Geminicoccaceae bacterium]